MLGVGRLLSLCFAALVLAANAAEKTITKTTTVTKRRRTTTSTTSYVTLTNTVTSYHYSYKTKIVRYGSSRLRPVTRRDLPEVELLKEQRAPRTTTTLTRTHFTTKTFTDLEVQGVYTYTTEHPDSTLTLKVTSCRGLNPTGDFYLQVVDSTPTRTDRFNSAFVTPTPAPQIAESFRVLDFISSQSSAALFNIDCIGRLIVYETGLRQPLFLNVGYQFPSFEQVYVQPQKEIEKRSYLYVYCDIVNGFLDCFTPQPPPTANLTMFQTCPLYDKYFDNPLVFANHQQIDSPKCFGFRFKPIFAHN